MEYETAYLPLEEAIALEAKQNMERDAKVLNEELGDVASYREEAEHLLKEFGEGWIPECEGHKLVKLKIA